MDRKAIDTSIKSRKMITYFLEHNNGVTESLYWLASQVGGLVSKVADLQKEVKTLRGKGKT